jgi:hypothetical protein
MMIHISMDIHTLLSYISIHVSFISWLIVVGYIVCYIIHPSLIPTIGISRFSQYGVLASFVT